MYKTNTSNIKVFFFFFFTTFVCIWVYSGFVKNKIFAVEKDVYLEPEVYQSPERHKEDSLELNHGILIFGDMMLDRTVADRISMFGSGYPFLNIKDILLRNKTVVANLEGVFTDNDSISRLDHNILRFTFDKALISVLKEFNFSILSQANNHTSDFGREGSAESKDFLHKEMISTFGDFFNDGDDVAVKDDVAFIGFNEFSYMNSDKVMNLIRKYKHNGNKVIVMPHWGIEYDMLSNTSQQKLARDFIDAGADIVVGAHPHVVQEVEIYKNKPIFYSLGNFVFDQDFSKETTEGLGMEIIFKKDNTEIVLIPFNIINSQVNLKLGEDRNQFLDNLSIKSSLGIQTQILSGRIDIGK